MPTAPDLMRRRATLPSSPVQLARWSVHVAFLAIATLITAFLFRSLQVMPWWTLSGLSADPGLAVAKLPVNYPFCADWSALPDEQRPDEQRHTPPPADLQADGAQVTVATTATAIAGGGQTNLGVLLPRKAAIVKVYCATARAESAMDECSGARCAQPMSTLIMDHEYTHGRALVVTFVNNAPERAPPVAGRLWVVWKEAPKL